MNCEWRERRDTSCCAGRGGELRVWVGEGGAGVE
jgi:hypothetical protein